MRLIAAAGQGKKNWRKNDHKESIPHSPSNWQLSCIQFGLESTDIGFEGCNRHGDFLIVMKETHTPKKNLCWFTVYSIVRVFGVGQKYV